MYLFGAPYEMSIACWVPYCGKLQFGALGLGFWGLEFGVWGLGLRVVDLELENLGFRL